MEYEIMSFNLIKGTFHVKGYSPDGDSIRFRAKDPTNWKKLSGPAVGLNALGHAQLRIEAMDALETPLWRYASAFEICQIGRTLFALKSRHP